MLAWAITVHKSQGQSIERLHVDLTRVFEYGQGRYPQLSRAINMLLTPFRQRTLPYLGRQS